MGCCEILNKVIDPVRQTMPTATWPELIAKCYSEGLDLSAKFMCVSVSLCLSDNVSTAVLTREHFVVLS